ncbi:hypothetical protein VKT23_004304 [Stygiomarasmius scandens]|uniref:Uncharacterized protein n=1 Tax=Marasmiellus scandens TaxID=2682957 RepID=A0ABR1JTQ4_9AGAR
MFYRQYAFAPSGKPQMRPPTHQSTHRQPGRNTMLQEKPQPPSRMMPPPRMPDNKSAPTSHNRNIPQSRPDASASKFHNQNLASPANHRFPSGNNGKAFVPAAPVYPPERLGTGIGRTSTAHGSTAVDSRALPRSSQPSVGGGSHRRPFVPR